MVRDRLVLAVLAGAAIGIFLIDLFVVQEPALPAAIYAVPIFLAAWWLRPGYVAALSLLVGSLELTAALTSPTHPLLLVIYITGIAAFGVLGTALAARFRREAALSIEAESRARELEAVAREKERFYRQSHVEHERWRAMAESMLDLVAMADAAGRITYINPAYQQRAGYSLDPSIPPEQYANYYQFRHPDGTMYELEDLPIRRAALRGEEVRGAEVVERTRDGRKIIGIFNAAPLRDSEGRVVGAVSVGRDVTAQREVEAERDALMASLTETNRRLLEANQTRSAIARTAELRAAELRSILNHMVEAVFVCDAGGRLTLANQAAERLLGQISFEEANLSVADLRAVLSTRFPDGRPIPPGRQPLVRALAGETLRHEDLMVRVPHTDTDLHVRVSASPLRDGHGAIIGAVSLSMDVSELVELEHLKDQLITVAAHELKTPVAIMKGYAQVLLRKSSDLSPERRRILECIDRGAGRIDSVVQEILDVSLLNSGGFQLTLERVDLAQFVGQAADRVAITSPNHRVCLTGVGRVSVLADRHRLDQVLDNLLDNAVRYSPAGGVVEVEIGVEADRAVVSVRDNGIGIPLRKQARIFERLYRAHSGTPHDYGGMGVGLYLAREIVRLHGGEMGFESTEGVGSTFRFSLPLGETHAEA